MPAERSLPVQLGFSTTWIGLPGLRVFAVAACPEDVPLAVLLQTIHLVTHRDIPDVFYHHILKYFHRSNVVVKRL